MIVTEEDLPLLKESETVKIIAKMGILEMQLSRVETVQVPYGPASELRDRGLDAIPEKALKGRSLSHRATSVSLFSTVSACCHGRKISVLSVLPAMGKLGEARTLTRLGSSNTSTRSHSQSSSSSTCPRVIGLSQT